MAAMEELGTLLQSLQALKPPGVTKSKIDAITAKCVENVQSDSTIVQKIVQQYHNSPVTHKLGVVYVLDSVTRQWVEKAKAAGQAIIKNAAPGTFASGVQKVTDVLPTLMSDLIQTAPDNQKEKISKLLDIWERGQTFPLNMLADFKQQLSASQNKTYTPPGSPPKGLLNPFGPRNQANPQAAAPPAPAPAPAPAAADPGALLAALAKMGQIPNTNPPPAAPAMPAVPTMPTMPVVPAVPQVPAPPPMQFPQNVAAPLPGFIPPPPVPATGQTFPPAPAGGNDMMQQLLGAIATGLIPPDKVMDVLAALARAQQPGAAPLFPPPPQPPVAANPPAVPQSGPQLDRYAQNDSRFRDRSRSPDFSRRGQSPDRRSPPHRRDSPTYGVYDPNARNDENGQNGNGRERGRGRGKNKGRGRDEYRQRTPPGQRRQPSPPRNGQQRFLEWDNTLPRDHIRVLSRTLFVGGAGGTEAEIRNIFSRFGKVQTCIVNLNKRHAFVKMVTRRDAVAAKEGMDKVQDPATLSKARQTRWGVGFGPRDCSDYTTGISVIPISRLTEADLKWVVTAEYGGTGGRPLEGGMVIEEPDIEIGAGVSSKAISRRVPPEPERRGGHGHGARGGGTGFDHGRFRKQPQQAQGAGGGGHEARHISPRPEPSVAVPPAVPGFGFQLPGFQM
ncbi:uncharacterized protein EI97DRAFT_430130 [Westerdykella ornata]|uniref:Uncharacterized protein n=1 Tax=Westerdykella ornata TaxID=318751 RepID=A0A6A6JWD0_WESOR|nr:uncharacterized protein EI97DRAFT_430130 [Westerdykella ornata]KAF2280393.1 hypothetical protein EI97DRAFT_430130 [Westerdykella ornata]